MYCEWNGRTPKWRSDRPLAPQRVRTRMTMRLCTRPCPDSAQSEFWIVSIQGVDGDENGPRGPRGRQAASGSAWLARPTRRSSPESGAGSAPFGGAGAMPGDVGADHRGPAAVVRLLPLPVLESQAPRRAPRPLTHRALRAYRRGVFDVRLRTLLGSPPGKASYAQYLTLLRNPSATESGPGFSTPSGSVRGECSRRGRCGGDVTPGTRPPADRRPSPCPASVCGDRCDAPALPCYRERSALTVLPPSAGCVTAVARARRLTMGQPKPPVAPVRSGVRVWGASGL